MDPDRISHLFRVTVEAAGVPKIRLHDLRHTAASLALATGIHPKVVSERLGHSSVAITLDIYSHLTPGLQEDAAERLGEILDVDDVQGAAGFVVRLLRVEIHPSALKHGVAGRGRRACCCATRW